MAKKEKNDQSIKLWLPESLYQVLQDLAAERDQSLSEYIRKTLEIYTFGAYHRLRIQHTHQDGRRGPAR